MRRLSVILLSTAAICAFASATPAVAQQMDPEGPARIAPTATNTEPPTVNGFDNGPFAALGAIFAGRTDAITSVLAATTPAKARSRRFRL